MKVLKIFFSVFLCLISYLSQAGQLTINSDQSDPATKEAFLDIIERFEKTHPDIRVEYNIYDKEAYKTAIRNWLTTSPPDIVHWYAGNRMKQFVGKNLFEDISPLWNKLQLSKNMPSATASMTIKGKQWGIPFSYYQWGIYYRKSIFKKLGLSEPEDWTQFLAACETIKKANIVPISIGTKYLWPAAGWFDYLNLRLNGLAFHKDLMEGRASYQDPKVKSVLDTWRPLVEKGYYLSNHATYSWQEALPFFLNGKAAMYLLGNFMTQNLGDQKSDVGFFRFPKINEKIPLAENAPIDSVHIPSKAKNKKDAKVFLAFLAQPENLSILNANMNQIPTHKSATIKEDYFLNKGLETLNAAQGTAQFYDRETSPAMAKEGMKGFQEFMIKPDRSEKILKRLERVRKREFKRSAH